MIEIKTKLRKWGNSFGVVVPSSKIANQNLKEGDLVHIFLTANDKLNLKNLFGKHKFQKPVQKLIKEMDEELYD